MLCAPLSSRGQLGAVLYLENDLAPGAFADRQQVLELLAGQIAISLENARLFAELERRVEARTQELSLAHGMLDEAQSLARIGSWSWRVDSSSASWSDELYRIHGYAPRSISISGRTLVDHASPEHKKALASAPTTHASSQWAPSATTFCATLAAPPSAVRRSRTRTTGTGASGEIRSTSPRR